MDLLRMVETEEVREGTALLVEPHLSPVVLLPPHGHPPDRADRTTSPQGSLAPSQRRKEMKARSLINVAKAKEEILAVITIARVNLRLRVLVEVVMAERATEAS